MMQTVKNIRIRTATLMDWLSVKSNLIQVAIILFVAVVAGALFYTLGSEQPATGLSLSKWVFAGVGATFGMIISACVVFSTSDFIQRCQRYADERSRVLREIAPPSDDLILVRQILTHPILRYLFLIPNPLWFWVIWVIHCDTSRMARAERTLKAKE